MPSLHLRAKDVFLSAVARPPAQRAAFVAAACGTDAELLREVRSLLAFHQDGPSGTPATPASAASSIPGTPAGSAPSGTFAPGEVFAERYRMVSRIGRGGMGDVWGADDLVLETPVALKLIDAGSGGRERILNEVRLARQITHPAVCRVFDVGEAGGRIFYSMELVRGEDLAALLRRVGRLPSEKVVDIARQLCAGLAAAHAQGVLHRDLKPANVLIDDDGYVRITDFGIAIPRTDADRHRLTGTPGYMAPEQRMVGTALTERTDVYALALVLYEMLAGRYAFSGSEEGGMPPPPSAIVPGVDPQLERVVMQALSPDPAQRPSSARALAALLPDPGLLRGTRAGAPCDPARRTNRWLAGAAIAAAVGVLAAAASFFAPRTRATLDERDTIVLAEFENTTGEQVFDGALAVALAVAVEQSPFLRVFPDASVRETLQLMARSADERVTPAIAREIARRRQLKALLAGSIASLGRHYVIALEAINAESGDVMAREQVEAASKEEVLTALGGATSRLREKLGESLASIQRFDVPLPKATTSSLEALHAYALGLPEGREVPVLEAIPHLERAVELDPGFAMAYAQLSSVYANSGQTELAPAYARRAFELRGGVSERERFFISWRYYRDAVQDWERAMGIAQSWSAAYPREAFAFNSLGSAAIRLGRFEDAVDAYREAIRLDPHFGPAYGNLAAALLGVGSYDEARAVIRDTGARKIDLPYRLSYLTAFLQHDAGTMARDLAASAGGEEANAAYGWQAHTAANAGRVAEAHALFRRGIQLSLDRDLREPAASLSLEDAEMHAVVGQCAAAREEAAAGLDLLRSNRVLERGSRVLALCGDPAGAERLAGELAARLPEATLIARVALPVTAAAVALERGDPARAIELLEPARAYDRAPSGEFWAHYLRGRAHLRLNDGRAAAADFDRIAAHQGEVPGAVLYPLGYLGAARAAALDGDVDAARRSYETFFALWQDADPDLPPLGEARLERSRLP
ncbi:MAG: protein kinase [Acidobacteria bacterium]|nr:protein kinase [Acidobacteriota bacterium]